MRPVAKSIGAWTSLDRILPRFAGLAGRLDARGETTGVRLRMPRVRIQFLSFDGCPLAHAARSELEAALARCGIDDYEEVDILNSSTPDELRNWGSPTILIDGSDVAGGSAGGGACCRVYDGDEKVPGRAAIISAIRARGLK